jgi:hypothetical protein
VTDTFIRADGQTTRILARRGFGRYRLVVEWLPPKLYTRFELFYGRDHQRRDWSVTCKVGRMEVGWYA